MHKEGTEAAEENLQLARRGLSSGQSVAVGKFNEEVTEQDWEPNRGISQHHSCSASRGWVAERAWSMKLIPVVSLPYNKGKN